MKSTNDVIREIFITHGFKIPPELTDMRPYVYEAARALLRHYGVWIREESDSNRTANTCKALDYGPTDKDLAKTGYKSSRVSGPTKFMRGDL